MILNLQNLPTKRRDDRRKRNVTWNLARKDGWERYKSLTKEKNDKIREVIEDEELDIEEVMDRLEKFENKIEFTAFGKTSKKASVPKKGGPKLVHIDESEKAKELIEKQSELIEEEVEKIRRRGGGKINQIHKIAKDLKGAKDPKNWL